MTRLAFNSLVQAAGFGLLIVLCVRVSLAALPELRRRRVLELAVYIIVTHLAIGVTQKDAWPITNYRLMHGSAGPAGELGLYTFYGVDSNGREWRVDPYAWRSISDWHLHFWFWINYSKTLTLEQQQQALGWLYGLAERQRAQLAAGRRAISPLGPFSAPEWWLFQRALNVPREPYRAFRVYLETFNVAGAMAEAEHPDRTTRDHLDRKFIGEWKPR